MSDLRMTPRSASTRDIEPVVPAASAAAFVEAAAARPLDALLTRGADYLELSKLRIASLVLVTVTVGFALGSEDRFDVWRLWNTLLGVTLAAAGSSALNQVYERRTDARMRRTASRPLPAGRIGQQEALAFGTLTAIGGPVYLLATVNLSLAWLTALTVALYVFVYTPMKRWSCLCTAVGAVPGALPPVLGWAAARGSLSYEAFGLFAILFLWQFPHFLAIAWIYQHDYDAAGLRMVPRTARGVSLAGPLAVLYAAVLLPASLLPQSAGLAGAGYAAAAVVLGLGYIVASVRFCWKESAATARSLLWTSLIYLPCLLMILAWDHYRLLN